MSAVTDRSDGGQAAMVHERYRRWLQHFTGGARNEVRVKGVSIPETSQAAERRRWRGVGVGELDFCLPPSSVTSSSPLLVDPSSRASLLGKPETTQTKAELAFISTTPEHLLIPSLFQQSSSMSSPSISATKPVFIPSRTRRGENARPRPRHAGVPPAVAALLAITTIPKPKKKNQRRKAVEVFYDTPNVPFACEPSPPEDDVLPLSPEEVWRNNSRAALELLLSPPDLDDFDDAPLRRAFSETRLSERSASDDSVPSLETDNESTFSESSSISASRRRASIDPRQRIIASPPEECDFDHPLLTAPKKDVVVLQPVSDTAFDDTLTRVTRRLNLKSNLTASLRVLKSAAKSFTSLTASATQPDDYLTRSILSISPTYRDERRPAPSTEIPAPAVRRYFNPWAATYDDTTCTGAIQMQTYKSSASKSGKAGRKGDVALASCACGPMVRQREQRENSDFLRVIVLEMNMRREGKLSDTAQGRARFVLPPRQPTKLRTLNNNRWEPWICVYDE
ncbi:hypothetical protein EX30DRAFT_349407 [Ascodesmis nigricans]|uniref:Uncharacterized protein n=1 Tax=Ascodesmis nigricans TaxID=341454 RepID=A0A4S2MVJ3_9PEZI|nr:hypothetical protein EX30DRAFT_349407 [Ascodesmis nigricans]